MSPLAHYVEQYATGGASPRTLAALALAVAVFAAGFWAGGVAPRMALAQQRTEAARTQARIAEHASRRLLDAQTHGDTLTAQLETANRAAMRLQENLDDQIRRATTGRPCLRQPALRLLDGAHGLRLGVPAPAGGPAPTDGAAAAPAGELVSSDTDVALWIAHAGRQYDECRRRLDALIDWNQQDLAH